MLEKLFRSNAEVKVLGVVLFRDGLHLREIARAAGVSPPEAKRELDSLVSLGVLVREKKGNLCVYSKNEASSILSALVDLYSKTEGAAALVKKALERVERVAKPREPRGGKAVKYAFVYGGFAKQTFGEKSDVDVLVVGDVDEEELASALFEAQKKVGLPINFILWSERDFFKKLREKSSFVKSLARGKRIWLSGDENEFKRLVKKAVG